jgi:hypothetical protein
MYQGTIDFIQSIASKPNVWFVTNQQLLQYMKNPVKASELGKQDYMQCKQPVIPKEICNGLDDDHNGTIDDGLINRYVCVCVCLSDTFELISVFLLYYSCNFGTTSMKTCFNCPTPASSAQNGSAGYRYPIPDNCE